MPHPGLSSTAGSCPGTCVFSLESTTMGAVHSECDSCSGIAELFKKRAKQLTAACVNSSRLGVAFAG